MSYDTYHLEPVSFEMCRKKSRAKLLFGKFSMGTLGVIGVIYTRFGKCMGTIWGHLYEVWEAIWGRLYTGSLW